MVLLTGTAVSAPHRALMKVVDRYLTPEDRNICMAGMIPSKFELKSGEIS